MRIIVNKVKMNLSIDNLMRRSWLEILLMKVKNLRLLISNKMTYRLRNLNKVNSKMSNKIKT